MTLGRPADDCMLGRPRMEDCALSRRPPVPFDWMEGRAVVLAVVPSQLQLQRRPAEMCDSVLLLTKKVCTGGGREGGCVCGGGGVRESTHG